MADNELKAKVNLLFQQGNELKDKARVSDYYIDKYKDAAKKYQEAAQLIEDILLKNQLKESAAISSKALSLYYSYESQDCIYSYEYKNENLQRAIAAADEGKEKINCALQLIDSERDNLDFNTKDFLSKMETNWKSSAISICIKQVEPIAKQAMLDEDYLKAFDNFNKMLSLQKKLYEYDEAVGLDPVHIRIAKGNYIGMTINVNQSLAGIISNKISNKSFNFDLTKDLLGHFLRSLELSFTAFEANPEWDKYRSGAATIEMNIKTLLEDNTSHWLDYLIDNRNNNYLHRIMRETDRELYNKERAKLELEKSKIKKFLLVGGFYFAFAFGLLYVFFKLATSDVNWYEFVGIIFGFPLFFAVVGAFVLRSTDSLKEDNFIQLMTLALKINLKGLKVLTKKSE